MQNATHIGKHFKQPVSDIILVFLGQTAWRNFDKIIIHGGAWKIRDF